MRLLHTSDWHVGKAIRGRSRLEEHRAVLSEIASIAGARDVDLVVVAGDLYETAAPPPDAEAVVYDALRALAEVAPVVVVAGNHDNPRRLAAADPFLSLGRVTVAAAVARPDDGGVHHLELGGAPVRLATVPFVSKRGIVRAAELFDDDAFEHQQAYDARLRAVVGALCADFDDQAVNLVVGHLFVAGATLGGGERSAHTVMDYAVGALAFPPTASYVALGHLHRPQDVPGATRIRYCGSPLQLDFGESRDDKSVTLVDLDPAAPARVEEVALAAGRRCTTLRGPLDRLRELVGTTGDDWLRIVVDEPRRAGMADEVRAWFPHAVDVTVQPPESTAVRRAARPADAGPVELFELYLRDRGVDDPEVARAFRTVLDEVTTCDP